MFQTDQATAAVSLPTPASAGTQGYFTNGNPGTGVAATILDADFMNMTMLELCNIVTTAGLTLSKTTYNQVLLAIKRLVQNQAVLTDTGAVNAYAAVNTPPLVTATWSNGTTQQIVVAHTNTGASTYSPDALTAIPIYGLGLQPLQQGEMFAGGTAILMKQTIAGVNSGNPIAVLLECAGGAQQIAPPTQSQHAVQFGQLGSFQGITPISGSLTLTTSAFGQFLQATGAGGYTVALPAAAGNQSKTLTIFNSTAGTLTLTAGNFNTAYGTGASIVLPPSSTVFMVSDNTSYNGIGGSAAIGTAIRPQIAAGVGQWSSLAVTGSGASTYLTLPAGGTWAYNAFVQGGGGATGIAAGGTNVYGPYNSTSLPIANGFAYRIA